LSHEILIVVEAVPDAGKPHVRICEGESRMAELLDRDARYLLMGYCQAYSIKEMRSKGLK
jgi:hypothetical protein